MSTTDTNEVAADVERLQRIRLTLRKAMSGNRHRHAVTPLLRSDAEFLIGVIDSLTADQPETKS